MAKSAGGKSRNGGGRRRPRNQHREAPTEAPASAAGQASGTTAGHNSQVRAGLQRDAFKKLWDLDRQITAEREKHIKPLQEERAEIWKNLRNDLGAKAADMNQLYALFKRDREVAELEDEDEIASSRDLLREGFQTLALGNTLNFIDTLGGQLFGRSGEAREAAPAMEETEGYNAGYEGKAAPENPWDEDTQKHKAWHRGWLKGQADKVNDTLGSGERPSEQSPTQH